MRVRLDAKGLDCAVRLGDQDISPIASDARIVARPGQVVSADIEVWAKDDLAVDVEAEVRLVVVAVPGFDVIEEPLPGGGKRIRVVPQEPS